MPKVSKKKQQELVQVSVRIPQGLAEEVSTLAEATGRKVRTVYAEMLRVGLEMRDKSSWAAPR